MALSDLWQLKQLTALGNYLTMSTMHSTVDDVRGFNRFYTRVLGMLRA
jgi:hypothetical protein